MFRNIVSFIFLNEQELIVKGCANEQELFAKGYTCAHRLRSALLEAKFGKLCALTE